MKTNQISLLLLIILMPFNLDAQEKERRAKVDTLLQLVSKAQNDSIRIEHTFDLARAYFRINKDSTEFYLSQTMPLAKKSNKKTLLGLAYYIKGWHQKFNRQYNESVLTLDTAIQYQRQMKDTFHLAESLSDIGLAYWRINQYDKSIKAYNEILSFEDTEQLKRTKLGACINTALVYEDQDLPLKAEKKYQESIRFAKELNDDYGLTIIYSNLSHIYRHRKEFKKSINYCHQSMALAKKLDRTNEYRRGLSELGATYTQMNKTDSASFYLKKSYQMGLDLNDGADNVKTAWHLGELYLKLNNLAQARQYSQISLQLAKKFEIPEDIAFGYEILFQIEKQAGNLTKANRWADSLVFWRDSLNRANNQEALADAEAAYNNKLLLKDNTIQAQKIQNLAKEKRYLRYFLVLALLLSGLVLLAVSNYFKKKKVLSELEMEMDHTIKLTQSVEDYRKKRAAELHDDVGQDLLLAQQSIQLNNPAERTQEFVERALNKVRKISKDEYPYELNYIGLKASLEYLIDIIEQNADIIISESIIDLPSEIPESQMLNMYRVIQEMLNNSIKNEDSSAVFIGMERNENSLVINYKDNGTGFDFTKNLNEGRSVGLKSIVNRVRMMKAELKVVPSPTDNRYQIIIPFIAER